MSLFFEHALSTCADLHIRAEHAECVAWQGRQALRLVNGLAIVPNQSFTDACIEVWINAEKAYPGIVFHLSDPLNYELAYAVPHASGLWDAIQYDPVFHGSNTWQMYHGSSYQATADVPGGQWFRLTVEVAGSRAAITVNDQPPLIVEELAHPATLGLVGVWTYLPAYFADLRVSRRSEDDFAQGDTPSLSDAMVTDWFVEEYGIVTSEPSGIINLNRYLPLCASPATLIRRFELPAPGELTFAFGFSDVLTLELDRQVIFQGENLFTGFTDRTARGYVEFGQQTIQQTVEAGQHTLTAHLKTNEPAFGWGLAMAVSGVEIEWLPVELG